MGAVIVFFLLYVLVNGGFGGGNTPAQQGKRRPTPEARGWNGQAVHIYNAQFTQKKQQMTLTNVAFFHLDKPRTSVVATLEVPAVNGKAPSWVKPKSFYGYQAVVAKKYVPTLKLKDQGAQYQVRIIFPSIPTGAVGPTCKSGGVASNTPLSLNFPGLPGHNLAVLLDAPPAPAGHCLSEPQPKPKVVTLKHAHGGKGTLIISGAASPGIQAVQVQIGMKKVHKHKLVPTHAHHFLARFNHLPAGSYKILTGFNGKFPAAGRGRAKVGPAGGKHHKK